ncbi:hypothetical protein NMY22_g13159 [Coprinellus aureogranulatus]|nr:hypothetical protein NMY22_g13159 [Coprinellus aureogranulatus]
MTNRSGVPPKRGRKRIHVTRSQKGVSEVQPLKDHLSEPSVKQDAIDEVSGRFLYSMDVNPGESCAPDGPVIDLPAETGCSHSPASPFPHMPPPDVVTSFCGGEDELRAEVKAQVIAQREGAQDSVNTDSAYSRHYCDYKDWWEADQGRRKDEATVSGKAFCAVPALPILPFKVCLFLEYSRTRPRTNSKGVPIPNTTLSIASLTQIVSALEHFRYLETGSKADKLRDDFHVRKVLEASERSEAQRQQEAQIAKAVGVQSQTVTRDQLQDIGLKLLFDSKNTKGYLKSIQDRGMLLVSVSMAMRGDNIRPICWSDMMLREVKLVNMGLDHKTMALLIYSNQGKTNKNAQQDFHPALRHRFSELCAIGAVAMQLFCHFHIAKGKRPSFEPNYDGERGTEYGWREWYRLLLFPSEKSQTEPMPPATHRRHVNAFKLRYDIFCQKSTHIGRKAAPLAASEFGAAMEGMKKLGLWREEGAFENVYDNELPIGAMLALAYYNGDTKNDYFVARDFLEPPQELESQIFPWVEEELAAYNARHLRIGRLAKDESLVKFLEVLRFFRRVLLQDVAALLWKHGREGLRLLDFAPFNTPLFLEFAMTAGKVIEDAEKMARENRKNMPETIAQAYAAQLTAVHAQGPAGAGSYEDGSFPSRDVISPSPHITRKLSRIYVRNVHKCWIWAIVGPGSIYVQVPIHASVAEMRARPFMRHFRFGQHIHRLGKAQSRLNSQRNRDFDNGSALGW